MLPPSAPSPTSEGPNPQWLSLPCLWRPRGHGWRGASEGLGVAIKPGRASGNAKTLRHLGRGRRKLVPSCLRTQPRATTMIRNRCPPYSVHGTMYCFVPHPSPIRPSPSSNVGFPALRAQLSTGNGSPVPGPLPSAQTLSDCLAAVGPWLRTHTPSAITHSQATLLTAGPNAGGDKLGLRTHMGGRGLMQCVLHKRT